jgi:dTDP-4-dehydrorhamnose 3,5-epimerase
VYGSLDTIGGAVLTPLRRIPTHGGDVYHALKASAAGFVGFGEAYFSSVEGGVVKGWKKHSRMTLNLVVPYGEVHFVIHNETNGHRKVFDLTPNRADAYGRLTISPGLWLAFGGVGRGLNLILNIANIEHDPAEVEVRPLGSFVWTWD